METPDPQVWPTTSKHLIIFSSPGVLPTTPLFHSVWLFSSFFFRLTLKEFFYHRSCLLLSYRRLFHLVHHFSNVRHHLHSGVLRFQPVIISSSKAASFVAYARWLRQSYLVLLCARVVVSSPSVKMISKCHQWAFLRAFLVSNLGERVRAHNTAKRTQLREHIWTLQILAHR